MDSMLLGSLTISINAFVEDTQKTIALHTTVFSSSFSLGDPPREAKATLLDNGGMGISERIQEEEEGGGGRGGGGGNGRGTDREDNEEVFPSCSVGGGGGGGRRKEEGDSSSGIITGKAAEINIFE